MTPGAVRSYLLTEWASYWRGCHRGSEAGGRSSLSSGASAPAARSRRPLRGPGGGGQRHDAQEALTPPPPPSLPCPRPRPRTTPNHSQRQTCRWGRTGALMVRVLWKQRPLSPVRLPLLTTKPISPSTCSWAGAEPMPDTRTCRCGDPGSCPLCASARRSFQEQAHCPAAHPSRHVWLCHSLSPNPAFRTLSTGQHGS